MKKTFIFCLLATILSLSFSSCSSADAKLEAGCKEIEKTLPMNIAPGMTMSSCSLNGNDMVFEVTVDEAVLGQTAIVELNNNKEAIKTVMVASLSANASTKKLAEICKEAKKNIVMKYVGQPSGTVCEISIDPNEL